MSNTAYLDWSLNIDCPKCGNENDISAPDDDAIVSNAIFHNNWDALKGFDVVCNMCGHDFVVDCVEY
jgi:hypothetical protein